MDRTALYRTIWRWHFYAGLFVMPFIVLLALSGAFYLFKPQVDRWEERAYRGLDVQGAVVPSRQVDAAIASMPGGQFARYRLPERAGDAAGILVAPATGGPKPEIFVSPQGKPLGSLLPGKRIMKTAGTFHANFLLGLNMGRIVETAACWAIVMVLTGLYLWWPRGRGLAGTLWPRRRSFVRDLHAVTGFWISALVLVLLFSGLPWAPVWGKIFEKARTEVGLVQGKPGWTIGGQMVGEHANHQHEAMVSTDNSAMLDALVVRAQAEKLAFPVYIRPPDETGFWTVKSEAQNRPDQVTISYDPATGREVSRETIADKHPIDIVIAYTTAWHEGQLFGWVNQLIGLLTASGLIVMVVTSFILWRRRKPEGLLGAPPSPDQPARLGGLLAILLVMAAALPMLAVSLVLIVAVERFVLPRFPAGRKWLGLPA